MRFFFLLFHSKNTYIYLFIQLHQAFLKILFSYYLFLAVLGLHCCPQASSSCREQWLLLLVVCRLLLLQRRSSRHVSFSNCSPHVQSLWLRALADPQHVKSSATRDQTHVLCSSRWILVYYITREVQVGFILKQDSVHIIKKVLLWRRPQQQSAYHFRFQVTLLHIPVKIQLFLSRFFLFTDQLFEFGVQLILMHSLCALGLSLGTRDLPFSFFFLGGGSSIFISACGIFVAACKIFSCSIQDLDP